MLPAEVRTLLEKSYPDYQLVTLELMAEYHRKLYLEDGGGSCPGVVSVDLFGDGSTSYAMILSSNKSGAWASTLVLAKPLPNERWRLEVLEPYITGTSLVVYTSPPGLYQDVYGSRELSADHDAVHLVGFEPWSIVYAWTGEKIEKIWISD